MIEISEMKRVKNRLSIVNRDVLRKLSNVIVSSSFTVKKEIDREIKSLGLLISGSSIYNEYNQIQYKHPQADYDFFFPDESSYKKFQKMTSGLQITDLDYAVTWGKDNRNETFYRSLKSYTITFPPLYPKINLVHWYVDSHPEKDAMEEFANEFDFVHCMAVYNPEKDEMQLTKAAARAFENKLLDVNVYRMDTLLEDDLDHQTLKNIAFGIGKELEKLRDKQRSFDNFIARYDKFISRGMNATSASTEYRSKVEHMQKHLTSMYGR